MELANQKQLLDRYSADWDISQEDLDEDFQPESLGPCFHCGRIVTDYDFCYGCDSYVCRHCNLNMEPDENHAKEAHLTKNP